MNIAVSSLFIMFSYSFSLQFKQKPSVILLDCSKLQLGRGRLDDSVTAFRRRLEIFRQSSLPMLKAMDNIGRLTIVSSITLVHKWKCIIPFLSCIYRLCRYIFQIQKQHLKRYNFLILNALQYVISYIFWYFTCVNDTICLLTGK